MRQRGEWRRTGRSLLEAELRVHPADLDGGLQRRIVLLVLVGVRLGEPGDRPVEGVAGAEVARDRDAVARPYMGPGELCPQTCP